MATAKTEQTNKVRIKLPITRELKEDAWVAVNGRSFQIKRGVEVEVPDYVAEVLSHQEEMLSVIAEFDAQFAN